MRVLIFGSSIAQGFWDPEGGWVARLRKYYDKQMLDGVDDDPPTIFNLGVSGDASDNLLLRLENEIKARDKYHDAIVVIAIGLNDTRTKSGKNYAEVETYVANLQKLLEQAQKYSQKILFVGLTPCDDGQANPVPWDSTTSYTNERIKEFDSALSKFCKDNNQRYVQVYEPFLVQHNKTALLPDSLHPNGEGHQLICDIVRPRLEELFK